MIDTHDHGQQTITVGFGCDFDYSRAVPLSSTQTLLGNPALADLVSADAEAAHATHHPGCDG